jgi:predicted membrane-bound mannosyltransferase
LPIKAPPLNYKHLLLGGALWLLVFVILFSAFFSNAAGVLDSFRTYIPWFKRAGGASPHIHPWSFYLHRLIWFSTGKGPVWSEAFILVLAMVGSVAGFARKGLGEANASLARFLAFYTVVVTAAYSLISYKTPWCLLNFWLTTILLAGIGAAVLLNGTVRPWPRTAAVLLLSAGAIHLGAQGWEAAVPYASAGNPYVYSQTSTNILKLVQRVEALAAVHPQGHRMLIKVMAPESDYWPLPWYLRTFPQVGWWDKVPSDPFAPVMIVSSKFQAALDENKTHLMPEIFQLRPDAFFELYVQLELWQDWLKKRKPEEQ